MIKIIKQNPAVLEQLQRGGLVHLNVLNYLEYAPDADVLTFDEDLGRGVIVRFVDDENSEYDDEGYFVATDDEEFLAAFWDGLAPGEKFFSGVPHEAAEILKGKSDNEALWYNPCYTYAYDPSTTDAHCAPLHDSEHPDDYLRINDVPVVDEFYTYRYEGSEDDFREAVLTLDNSCVRIDGELAAWCLVHVGDGSLGPLYTMEAHRRKGLAELVSARLFDKLAKKGKTPYMHIVKSNEASLKMAKKLQLKYSHDATFFGLKK